MYVPVSTLIFLATLLILGESEEDPPEDMIGLLYSMEWISELKTVSFKTLLPLVVVLVVVALLCFLRVMFDVEIGIFPP